jgi:hypothetical protein
MTAKHLYFFKGSEYVRFDSAPNAVPIGYPLSIATWWGGLPDDLDAALNRGKGQTYFFKGDQYYRYTVVRNAVDPGYPKPIAGNWPGMSDVGFASGIDAAVNWADGKIYFFKGSQYVRYDLPSNKVEPGYPKPIAGNWPGVAGTGFENGIDDAVNYGNGKVYFFKGDQYLRLDHATKKVDTGYPLPIGLFWPGMANAGFGSGIGAVIEWPYAELAPGGFNVPTGRTPCGIAPATGGLNRGGEQFRMELDFHEPTHPAACAVGEYRQFARGTIVINGTAIAFGMPNSTPGGPAVTLQPRPAAGAASDNFLEDGIPSARLGGGGDFFYGRRLETRGFPTDVYQAPDRLTGCQFRGFDAPGYSGPPGDTFAFDIDFRGEAIDRADSTVLQTTMWTFNCSGTL